jgi:hypothetical protein
LKNPENVCECHPMRVGATEGQSPSAAQVTDKDEFAR